MNKPRLLIEEWLPAQAIGIECARENQFMAPFPPNRRLHVWWARRPLIASRAAVLASLLPADFDRVKFERLLGFGKPASEMVRMRKLMDSGVRLGGFGVKRAFSNPIRVADLAASQQSMQDLWDEIPSVIDPMAGGGSIPLEAARLGLTVFANELNSVACSILEATLEYPYQFGKSLAEKTRKWGKIWRSRCMQRLEPFFPKQKYTVLDGFIFARTVPCPDTGFDTPLVSNWTLLKPAKGVRLAAEPIVNREQGIWTTRIRELGKGAGQLRKPPKPTYRGGKGISIYTEKVIPSDYIKNVAQQGKMGSALYAVALKTTGKTEFRPPNQLDLRAIEAAERELHFLKPGWAKAGIIPTEEYPDITTDKRPKLYGMPFWADMYSPRQLLTMGVLVEELIKLMPEIESEEELKAADAIIHILAFAIDKMANFNCMSSRWTSRGTIAGKFDRHDYAFKNTYAEVAVCEPNSGLDWAIEDVAKAYEDLAKLPGVKPKKAIYIFKGSATNLIELNDKSITAVIVDPPYEANVQYSELADFFYVWLKRTQGQRHPEWFSTYLSDHDQEAVVNLSRHRKGRLSAGKAKEKAYEFYQTMMRDSFREANRVLRDDGVLTVMFTHKEQQAWAALFESIIWADFTITATWPVKTESETSLHQAKKNAAQSTVILVARKREQTSEIGYYDEKMKGDIRQAARSAADRLQSEGLNPVDQLVGAFGPAMEVFSRHGEVYTDTGERVPVAEAIQMAADAVAKWRVEQLAERSLEGIDPESRVVLVCWDVLEAVEFRFNEAMLLGRSVGMDVNALIDAGLVVKKSDKVLLLSAKERRREKPIKDASEQLELLPGGSRKRGRKSRKVHPNDQYFVSAIDMCHALALRHAEAGGGEAGIGAAKGMALQQGWTANSPCARLMEALVHAAPQAVRFPGKGSKKTVADTFPEFRVWHAMLRPLFGTEPPEWKEPVDIQPSLPNL
jgi:putative DNA methylase